MKSVIAEMIGELSSNNLYFWNIVANYLHMINDHVEKKKTVDLLVVFSLLLFKFWLCLISGRNI